MRRTAERPGSRLRRAFLTLERLEPRFLLSATDMSRAAVIPLSVIPAQVRSGIRIDPASPFVKDVEVINGAITPVSLGQAGQVDLSGTLRPEIPAPSYQVPISAGLSALAISFRWQAAGNHGQADFEVFDASGHRLADVPIGEGLTIALEGLDAHASSSLIVRLQPGPSAATLGISGGKYQITFSRLAASMENVVGVIVFDASAAQQSSSGLSGPFVGTSGSSAGSTQGQGIGVPPPGVSSQVGGNPGTPGIPLAAPPPSGAPTTGPGTVLNVSTPLPSSAPRPLGGLLGADTPVPLIAGQATANLALGQPSISATQTEPIQGGPGLLAGTASHVAPAMALIPAALADRLFGDGDTLSASWQPSNVDLGLDLPARFRPRARLVRTRAGRADSPIELSAVVPWIQAPVEFANEGVSARSARGAFLPSAAELAAYDAPRGRSQTELASPVRSGPARPWRTSLAMGINGALMLAVGLFGPDLALAFRRVLRAPRARHRVRRSGASPWHRVRVESKWLA